MAAKAQATQRVERTPPFLIAGRLALLALALCAASFKTTFSSDDGGNWLYTSLGILFGANLLLVVWFSLKPDSRWLRRVHAGFDVSIVTAIIYYTGGTASPYLFLYLPVLFLARITNSLKNSATSATFAIFAYAVVAYLTDPAGASLQPLITQIIILAASISLVMFGAQYLMHSISAKEAQVTKSKLDLHELVKGQLRLLEKLPYGVISLAKDLRVLSANKKAGEFLGLKPETLIDKPLCEILTEVTNCKVQFSSEQHSFQLDGLPAGSFSYEVFEAGEGGEQHSFFIFERSGEIQNTSSPKLLRLEDRLRELLSDTSNHHDHYLSTSSRTFIAESTVMQKVFALIERAAPSDATVLIQGESGTGKELVARALHENSPRTTLPFVTVNCGAIPENLIESTLFGHKKGAFTGAIHDAMGLIREAEGGTLFLDEIGELPLHTQAKLLRALQERTVRPVGGERDYEVNVRIVAATNRNLRNAVESGTFRDDLFYRLNVIAIPLPALRDRKEDLPILINTFLRRLSLGAGNEAEVSIASDAMQLLLHYDYPGNVRELENILERAFVLGGGAILGEHLADLKLAGNATNLSEKGFSKETRIIQDDQLVLPLSLDEVLATLERRCISLALQQTEGHRTKAAELLGINLRSFRYRAQKLGL